MASAAFDQKNIFRAPGNISAIWDSPYLPGRSSPGSLSHAVSPPFHIWPSLGISVPSRTHPLAAFCDPCLVLFPVAFPCDFLFPSAAAFLFGRGRLPKTCLSLPAVFRCGLCFHSLAIFCSIMAVCRKPVSRSPLFFDAGSVSIHWPFFVRSWPSAEDTETKTGCLAGSRFISCICYSTVTDFARLRGLSTSHPLLTAA